MTEHYPDDLHRLVQEVAQTPGSFQTCSEARAVHYEIINFLNALTSKQKLSDETAGSSLLDPSLFGAPASRSIPQSLMESKEAQAHTVYEMEQISSGVQHVLDLDVHVLLRGDANVATDALQTILSYVQTEETLQSRPGVAPQIIELCATVLHETDASEVRRLAVEILAIQLNGNIEQATMDSALQKDQLVTLWSGLQDKSLNPGLADSVIRASGTLVKTVTAQVEGNVSERWLRSWGVMMRKAGSVENVRLSKAYQPSRQSS